MAPKTANRAGPTVRRSLVALLCLLLTACGRPDAAAPQGDLIAYEELPPGLGRGVAVVSLAGVSNVDSGMGVGALPPNFELILDDGRRTSLRSLQGRPVLLNFWATWCSPCRLEMPELVAASQNLDDLIVLAINVEEDAAIVQPFLEEFEMTMAVGLDSSSDLFVTYQLRGLPASVFIQRDGLISSVWNGLLTAQKLEELLAPIL